MTVEEKIKYETDKFIKETKEKYKQNGMVIDDINELFLRMGIAQGMLIVGVSLLQIDGDLIINKENNNEIKNC